MLDTQNQKSKIKNLLLVFTRNPKLGKVKSRLAAAIGDDVALEIYKFLLQHTFTITKDLACDKCIYYSDRIPKKDLWDDTVYQKKQQQGADLGSRMQQAFEQGFADGYQNIIIIGSDLYDLGAQDLSHAFEQLTNNDCVLGPATDGGYYLLGMKQLHPEVFHNKTWGTDTVLQNTLHDLKNNTIALLDPRNDVDYLEDIQDIEAFQRFLR